MTTTAAQPARLAPDKKDWTLAAVLHAAAAARPDRLALRTMRGEQVTYSQVLARAESRAAGLRSLGVSAGDRVVLVMDNSIEMVLTWFAINLLGAVEVPSNTANRGHSLEHVINSCGAAVAVVDSRHAELLAGVSAHISGLQRVVINGPDVALPWATCLLSELAGSREPLPVEPATYRDPAAIMYTSGTTGPAKGVVVSHSQMYLFAGHVVEQLEICADDVYYVCLPFVPRQRTVHAGVCGHDRPGDGRASRQLQREQLGP